MKLDGRVGGKGTGQPGLEGKVFVEDGLFEGKCISHAGVVGHEVLTATAGQHRVEPTAIVCLGRHGEEQHRDEPREEMFEAKCRRVERSGAGSDPGPPSPHRRGGGRPPRVRRGAKPGAENPSPLRIGRRDARTVRGRSMCWSRTCGRIVRRGCFRRVSECRRVDGANAGGYTSSARIESAHALTCSAGVGPPDRSRQTSSDHGTVTPSLRRHATNSTTSNSPAPGGTRLRRQSSL